MNVGGDCDDNDSNAYPNAPELCNGAVDSFGTDGLCNETVPEDEIDDDGDCFVECYGFDSNTWEGGIHNCEHVDSIGQIVQETVVIGGMTFSGSILAWGKLSEVMTSAAVVFGAQRIVNAAILVGLIICSVLFCMNPAVDSPYLYAVIGLALLFGVMAVLPIGGADMPVVISMLNSYSGWAAAGIGFTLENTALIITGALVGSSGAILSYIMCKGMNRSFFSVILGGFGGDASVSKDKKKDQKPVKSGNAEDAAFLLKNASSVIIVPGYGMAVAQAQHALREMVDTLKKNDIKVSYAVHPVAGRMPGHMNVLLAEANVPYDEVFELDDINNDFANTDVAFVIGANDVTNPVAKTDPQSPIFGMPVLDVEKCKSVLFVKRSLSPGYAGVDNELCLLYTSPSPRDLSTSRMPSSA